MKAEEDMEQVIAGEQPVRTVAYILMKYPTLSQTFIDREMRAVATHGWRVEVHPCFDFRRSEDILEPVPPGLEVVRPESRWQFFLGAVRGTWREVKARPALLGQAARLLWSNLPTFAEGWFMTFWGTLFALARAEEFRRRGVSIIHGAWASHPATAAAVLAELCGKPFSFGAHAYDLHRHGGDPMLAPKLRAARFVHTTTEANVRDIARRYPDHRAGIVLARRGLRALPPLPATPNHSEDNSQGVSKKRPFRILSVGRLVEKKGHILQVDACWELARRGVPLQLKIIGDGPLRTGLQARIAAAGLSGSIELAGEREPQEVTAAYAWADVFWHTGIVDSQGDRDGLPNVVPEALAHALPVISSAAGGAAEAIHDGETGLLVNPQDTVGLADAIERLANDPALCHRLGTTGRAWMEENFLAEKNTLILARAFEAAIGVVKG